MWDSLGEHCGWSERVDPSGIRRYDDFLLIVSRWPGTGLENETGVGNIFNATLKAGTTSKEFNAIFEQKILNAIDKFKPEIILISAGFDAHKRDPLANISLESDDFFKITKNIVDIANTHSNGRIISFLEGGYDLQALSESIIEHLNALKPHI